MTAIRVINVISSFTSGSNGCFPWAYSIAAVTRLKITQGHISTFRPKKKERRTFLKSELFEFGVKLFDPYFTLFLSTRSGSKPLEISVSS
jgi:hypothetical protein